MACQVECGDAHDLTLLRGGDRLERAAVRPAASGPHLDERDGTAVERDQVELPRGTADVALENRVAARTQEGRGDRLALGAAAQPLVRHDTRIAARPTPRTGPSSGG